MATVGRANVELSANTAQFNRGMKDAERAFDNANKNIIKGLKGQGEQFKRTSGAAVAFGTAIGTATIALTRFAKSSFRVAADVAEMNQAIKAIGKSSGAGAFEINKAAAEIRGMGIEMKAAQEIALLFVQGNLDLAKASKVARVAQDLAVISQSNSTETAKLLAYAIQTGNSRLLKSAGITKYASEAYEDYAKAVGKSTTALSASERQTAVMNMIIEEGGKVAGTYEAAMNEAGKVLRSFPRIINDIQLAFGQVFMKDLGEVIKSVYNATKAFSLLIREGGALRPVIDQLAEVFSKLIAPVKVFFDDVTTRLKNMQFMEVQVDGIGKAFERMVPGLAAAAAAMSTFAGTKILGGLLSMFPVVNSLAGPLAAGGPLVAGIGVLAVMVPEFRDAMIGVLDVFKPLLPIVMDLVPVLGLMATEVAVIAAELIKAFTPTLELMIYNIAGAIESMMPVVAAATELVGAFADAINGIDAGKIGEILSYAPYGIGFLFQGADEMEAEKSAKAINDWATQSVAAFKRVAVEADPEKFVGGNLDEFFSDILSLDDLYGALATCAVTIEDMTAARNRLVAQVEKHILTEEELQAQLDKTNDKAFANYTEQEKMAVQLQYVMEAALEKQKVVFQEAIKEQEEFNAMLADVAASLENTYFYQGIVAINDFGEKVKSVTEKIDAMTAAVDAGGVTFEQYVDTILGAKTAKFQTVVAMDRLRKSTQEYLDDLAGMKKEEMDLIAVQNGMLDAFVNLGVGMKNAGKSSYEIQFAQAELIKSFMATMETIGLTRDQINDLINEMGILDGMDPVINVLLDVDANVRNTEHLLRALEAALFFDPTNKKAQEMYSALKNVSKGYAKAAQAGSFGLSAGTYTPTGGGGGAEAPYDRVGALQGLAGMFGPKDAEALLGASPDQIAEQIDYILGAGLEVASNLDGKAKNNVLKLLKNLAEDSLDLQALSQSATNFAVALASAEDELATAEDNLASAMANRNAIQEEQLRIQQDSIQSAKDQIFMSDMLQTRSSGVVFAAEDIAGKYRTHLANLKEMQKRGFPPSLIAEVYNAGPGAGIAANILSMDEGGIENYLSAYKEVEQLAAEVGAIGATALLGGDLAVAQAEVALAQSDVQSAKENVAKLDDSLTSLEDAIYTLVSTMQVDFLESIKAIGGGAAVGSMITEATTGITGPNQALGTSPTNITVNMPAGSDGEDVVRALQEYMRKNGSVPILTVEP